MSESAIVEVVYLETQFCNFQAPWEAAQTEKAEILEQACFLLKKLNPTPQNYDEFSDVVDGLKEVLAELSASRDRFDDLEDNFPAEGCSNQELPYDEGLYE